MKTVCFYLTERGHKTAQMLAEKVGCDIMGKSDFNIDFKTAVKEAFEKYNGLIFVMATGIVVRTIAPLLQSKVTDPCVVVVDQNCEYAISLLSGHLGGGNELARLIQERTGANAVITTATDVQNVCSFDMLAKKYNAEIENIEVLKKISSRMLDGKPVDFITTIPLDESFGENVTVTEKFRGIPSVVFDIYNYDIKTDVPILYIRPKCVYLGIGCKRDTKTDYMLECLKEFLACNNISSKSIKAVTTIELKHNEKAINDVCSFLDVPLVIADNAEINKYSYRLECSEFVEKTTGVVSVAEGSAVAATNGGELIAGKTRYKGITFALVREAVKAVSYD